MMSVVTLPGVLDTSAAAPLHQELLDRLDRRQPLVLDGAAVVQVGQACLQLIASAAATAATAGLSFAVRAPSDALRDGAALAGLGAILAASDGKADR